MEINKRGESNEEKDSYNEYTFTLLQKELTRECFPAAKQKVLVNKNWPVFLDPSEAFHQDPYQRC